MKRTILAIALCATAGYAGAYEEEVLAPVIVEHVDSSRLIENCTPPADAPECAGFHALIRQNFSEREIGMLFGGATAYPEYRTSYSMVRDRYENLVRWVEDNGLPATAVGYAPIRVIDEPYGVVSAPAEREVVVNDADALVVSDDPDAELLGTTPVDTTVTTRREVVYYEDDDGTLRPRRE